MNFISTSRIRHDGSTVTRSARAGLVALSVVGFASVASAAGKPPLAPDGAASFSTDSRISATIEFGLPALAGDIEKDIPRRLATIDERISCVHRRVLFFRVNANCDVSGYVERGPVSLYGRGDHIYGSVPIYGAIEGQGANRFTARIHGETEASATVESEVRPQLRPDWSIDLNFSDGFRWSEPPVLHVMGREIPLANYAEPRIREQLAVVRSHAAAAARRLDLQDKAARAWRHTFEPIQLSESPPVWLQMTPQSASFAGVRADARVLRGSIELSGTAETSVGQTPPTVTETALPPLGRDVSAPGQFDVILPVSVSYDLLKDKLRQTIAAMEPSAGITVRDVDAYPSSGKLVVGLRVAKAAATNPDAGKWIYLTGSIQVDADGRRIQFADLGVASDDEDIAPWIESIATQLRSRMNVDYGIAYDNLLNAVNAKLNRPLKDGFRMEGQLSSAKLEKVYLSAGSVVIALRSSGTLTILYGM